MNDNDIVKAFECCVLDSCNCTGGCPYRGTSGAWRGEECWRKAREDLFDLINRQKAEIERLEKELNTLTKQCYKSGIKDLAERLREKSYIQKPYGIYGVVDVYVINHIVEEMTEETP